MDEARRHGSHVLALWRILQGDCSHVCAISLCGHWLVRIEVLCLLGSSTVSVQHLDKMQISHWGSFAIQIVIEGTDWT